MFSTGTAATGALPVGHVPVDLCVSHVANLPLQALHDRVLLLTIHLFHDYLASSAAGSSSSDATAASSLVSSMKPSHMSTVCRYSVRITSSLPSSGSAVDTSAERSRGSDVFTLLDNCTATFPISLTRGKCVFRLTLAHLFVSRRTGEEKAEPLAMVDFAFSLKALLHEKARSFLLGTICGQVGLSFSVGAGDVDGYASRLEAFAGQYCPAIKPKISQIVQSATELQCFSKLYTKFGLVDFAERLEYFFYLYRLGDDAAAHATLEKWAGNEILLLSKLVVEHGPEPRDIPRALRARAFADEHRLQVNTINTQGSWEVFSMMMAELVLRYGPEPHPRTYLFPPVVTTLPLSPDAAVSDSSRSRLRELHRAQFPVDPDDPENYRHLRFDERTSVYIAQQRAKSSPWPLNKEQEQIERAQKKTSSFAYDAVEVLEAKPAIKVPTYAEQLARDAEREKFQSTLATKHFTVESDSSVPVPTSSAAPPRADPVLLRQLLGQENTQRVAVASDEEKNRRQIIEEHIYGCRQDRERNRARLMESGERKEVEDREAYEREDLAQYRRNEQNSEAERRKRRDEQERVAQANTAAALKASIAAARESSNRLTTTRTPPPPPPPPPAPSLPPLAQQLAQSSDSPADPSAIAEWNRRVVVPPERTPFPPLTSSILQVRSTEDTTGSAAARKESAGPIRAPIDVGSKSHWADMCSTLNIHHIPFDAIFYLSDIRFANLCFELGIRPNDAEAFARERHRKIFGGTAIDFESVDSGPGKAQVDRFLRLVRVAPIHFHFSSVGAVTNKVHAEVFQQRVDDALKLGSKSAAEVVYRRFLIMPHAEAMQACFFGLQSVGPVKFFTSVFDAYARRSYESDAASQLAAQGQGLVRSLTEVSKSIQLMEIGSAAAADGKAADDPRELAGKPKGSELTVLLCDVLAGNVLEIVGEAPAQLPVEYDAAICRQGSEGEALVVYNPRSVLPVAWISCDIDIHAEPCANHPNARAVPLPKTAHSDLDGSRTLLCAACLAARVAKDLYDPPTRLLDPPAAPYNAMDIIGVPRLHTATSTSRFQGSPDRRDDGTNRKEFSPSPSPAPASSSRGGPLFRQQDISSPDVNSMMRSAWALYRQGNINGAASQWRAMFQMYPETSEGREALGIIAEVCDSRLDEAVSLYQSALDVNPYSCSALYRCANLLETHFGEYSTAQELFDRCAALGDETGARRAVLLRSRLAGGANARSNSSASLGGRGPTPRGRDIAVREELAAPVKKYFSSFQVPPGRVSSFASF